MPKSISEKVKHFIHYSDFCNVKWLDYIQRGSWHEKQLIRFIQKLIRDERKQIIKASRKEL